MTGSQERVDRRRKGLWLQAAVCGGALLLVAVVAGCSSDAAPAEVPSPSASAGEVKVPKPTVSPEASGPVDLGGLEATDLWVNGLAGVAYLTRADGTVHMVDLGTGEVTLVGEVGPDLYEGTVDWSAQRMLLSSYDSGHVVVLDLSTGDVVAEVPATRIGDVVVDETTHTAYVASSAADEQGAGSVLMVDTVSGALRGSIPVSNWPHELAVDSGSGALYVVAGLDVTLTKIDLASGAVAFTVPVPEEPLILEVTSAGGLVAATGRNTDVHYVVSFDTTTGQVVTSCAIPDGAVTDLALDEDRGVLYAASGFEPSVVVTIDLASWTITATGDAGHMFADGVEVDRSTGQVYTTDGDGDGVFMFPAP